MPPLESTTTRLAVAVPMASAGVKHAGDRGLLLIGIFKFAKGLLFFAAAFGLLRMVHKDTRVELTKVLHVLRIDGDRSLIRNLLVKANVIGDPQKVFFGSLAALSAVLFTTEGIGLLMRKKWAEYMTVILTATGIPIELYEIFHRTSHPARPDVISLVPDAQRTAFLLDKMFLLKLAALLCNALILWFLIAHLKRLRRSRRAFDHATAVVPELAA